jgi:hypothetical protein
MTRRNPVLSRLAAPWLIVLAAGLLPGCTISHALKGEPGKDLSSLRPGITRAQVEQVVGQTEREWTTALGVRYRLYRYDAGKPPSGDAAGANALMDVLSVGMFELFVLGDPGLDASKRETHDLAVSYDKEDAVIGIFKNVGTTTQLPADGRPEVK